MEFKTQTEQIAELQEQLASYKRAERDAELQQSAEKNGLDWLPHVKHLLADNVTAEDIDAALTAQKQATEEPGDDDEYLSAQLARHGIGVEESDEVKAKRAALIDAERKARKSGDIMDIVKFAQARRELGN